MADAAIDLQASNIFSLPTGFNTQSSTSSVGTQNVATNDESGNVVCQKQITEQTDYTQSATYCLGGEGGDFVGSLNTFLTKFGTVQGVGVVTQLTVNMTAGEYVSVDITGHQHSDNAHTDTLAIGYADVSDFLPHYAGESFSGWDGFGVPDFGITLGTDASPSSATVTFTMNHIDVNDEAGDHLAGKNITPRCELSMDFEGIPTSNTATTIQADLRLNNEEMLSPYVDSVDTNDSNSEFDTFSFTAHANTDLATA